MNYNMIIVNFIQKSVHTYLRNILFSILHIDLNKNLKKKFAKKKKYTGFKFYLFIFFKTIA